MKTTNEIEKALENKIDIEIAEVVDVFVRKLKDLYDTYGGTSYYSMKCSKHMGGYDKEQQITCLEKEKVRTILEEMIKENHGEVMLKKKTKQLLAKLEIL
jgi:hypothetical protein